MSHEELDDIIEFEEDEVVHACEGQGSIWNDRIAIDQTQKR